MYKIAVASVIGECVESCDTNVFVDTIQDALRLHDGVLLDFTRVCGLTISFFNNSLGRVMELIGKEEYDSRIHCLGLSEFGKLAYERSYVNCVKRQ